MQIHSEPCNPERCYWVRNILSNFDNYLVCGFDQSLSTLGGYFFFYRLQSFVDM